MGVRGAPFPQLNHHYSSTYVLVLPVHLLYVPIFGFEKMTPFGPSEEPAYTNRNLTAPLLGYPMARIFISYSRVDKPFAERFSARLRKMFPDVDVWLDSNLLGGDIWWIEILNQTAACDVFIYLLSNESVQSPYCYAEFTEARRLQKCVITVQVRDRTELTKELSDIHWVDMKAGVDDPDALTDLAAAVRIQLSKAVPKPPLWEPATPKPVVGKEKIRPADAPDIDTPPLYDPAPAPLPPPFEWIEIPSGWVEVTSGRALALPTFMLAKYPITNAQYAKFVEAGGYSEKAWWTAAGWNACQQGWAWSVSKSQWEPTGKPWTEPRFWKGSQWNRANQPVVGVSWYEAVAFCQWLSEASDEFVMLPTEQQWQRAAQGDDGRNYPWGNRWDGHRCNNSVRPFKNWKTTPVREYQERGGNSAFEVVDMAGNAWEWCLTDDLGRAALEGKRERLLCGGSWKDPDRTLFQVTGRSVKYPYYRLNYCGFRCARSVGESET
jgi:formylglycine-generating enzyme required for sulfatase activity